MQLNELKPITPKKRQKRLGRGDGSGHGGTSTKGHKGQKARSGGFHKRGFEGGQMPLTRRIPKRGFVNTLRRKWGIVNLVQLETLPKGTEVNLVLLKEKRWVPGWVTGFKVLANGELKKALTIRANQVSEAARKKIEKSGSNILIEGAGSQ